MIHAVIFDYGRTLHDPFTDTLFPGVQEVIDLLKKSEVKLALVSRTADVEKRYESIKGFGLDTYFDVIKVFPIDKPKDFKVILELLKVKPEEVLVVGDQIASEILEGNKVGAVTVWFRQGEFFEEKPKNDTEKPDYIISSMNELLALLPSLISNR